MNPRTTLVGTFLARFFENEITGGSNDLRQSFFWLIALLAVPGVVMPAVMAFDWSVVATYEGSAVLQVISRADKVLYLGFAMIAPAAVCAVVWNSLLIDRRDALILGALPVRPAAIVRGKLLALAAYIGILAVGMHAVASLAWGFLLGSNNTIGFALRGTAAHFIASCAASLFVFLAIAGAQGLLLAGLGPRLFARASPILQLGLVVAIGAAAFALPAISTATVDTVLGHHPVWPFQFSTGAAAEFRRVVPPHIHPWILQTPPLWFLGLYEWLLGARDAVLNGLAAKALLALAAAMVLAIGSYAIGYRRVMVRVIEGGADAGRVGRSSAIVGVMARIVSWTPQGRAVAQFLLTTIARVDRQRFAIAIGAGASLAWALPTAAKWIALWPNVPPTPQADLLALPLSMMLVLLVGTRIAASLPADLKASWIFDVLPPSPRDIRGVMERLMLVFGVAPFVVLFLPLHWWLWGARVALTHGIFTLTMGILLIQMLLRRFTGVPCTHAWRPERAQMRFRGPVYFLLFLWFASGMPQPRGDALEVVALRDRALFVTALIVFLGSAIALRWRGMHEETEPPGDDETLGAAEILHLN